MPTRELVKINVNADLAFHYLLYQQPRFLSLFHQTPNDDRKRYKEPWKRVQKELNECTTIKTYEDFLTYLNVSEEEYLSAICSSINSKKVFLKRDMDETRINNYNATLLKSWRANMDLQFILDAYACAMYIVSYRKITKRKE